MEGKAEPGDRAWQPTCPEAHVDVRVPPLDSQAGTPEFPGVLLGVLLLSGSLLDLSSPD